MEQGTIGPVVFSDCTILLHNNIWQRLLAFRLAYFENGHVCPEVTRVLKHHLSLHNCRPK